MKAIMTFVRHAVIAAIAVGTTLPALAQDSVMFNYQGRVKVQGQNFDGNGTFKFAILSPNGKSTLWSNDNTSVDGSEPTTGLSIPVTNGVFNVLMGESGKMNEINSTIFQHRAPLKLRTWFSDGTHGFQALHPDHNLINTNLITSQTGDDAFTIYVNGQTGDDSNSGLKPNQAKKTIQAAVDIVPSRVMTDVTIDIADGTYAEEVKIFGITVKPGKSLRLVGDDSWTSASENGPGVIVSGAEDDSKTGISIIQTSGISLVGLEVSGFNEYGVIAEASLTTVTACKLVDNQIGISAFTNSSMVIRESVANDNEVDGIYVAGQSSGQVINCIAMNNGTVGIRANAFSTLRFLGNSTTAWNGIGLLAQHNSSLVFTGEVSVLNNWDFGLDLRMDSYTENYINGSTVIGNGNGNLPRLLFGSHLYDF